MIEFKNVSVSFILNKIEFNAVKDVSFKIEQGDIFGIVGSSGAGKSTLLNTINRLQTPTNGSVLINNQNITKLKGDELRKLRHSIGMIFQHFNLAKNLTVYDNIAFNMKACGKTKIEIEKRVDELLELVDLTSKKFEFPQNLSGGQKQRVGIARSIANDVKILLCDEPTSALDPEATDSILNLLKNINKKMGLTIVVITHEMDVIKKLCSHVAVMHNGILEEVNDVYSIFTKAKSDFTKSLTADNCIDDIINFEKYLDGITLKLTYIDDKANAPILYEMAKKFDTPFNIIHGQIEYINQKALGTLYVNITGVDRLKAVDFLKENLFGVEVLYAK